MSATAQYAIALGVVFAVNLLPAFGPPTWAVLLFFSIDFALTANRTRTAAGLGGVGPWGRDSDE